MMATTHAFVGAGLAVVAVLVTPAVADVAIFAGFLGGIAPDLDVVRRHRRSLHYPVLAPPVAAGTVLVALLAPTTATIAAAAFAVAFALHPLTDVVGGSLELRPWRATTDRAVYDHVRHRWLSARRWVRYDGAPEDFALCALASLPMLVLTDGWLRDLALVALAVSAGYALVRRRLPDALASLASRLPVESFTVFPDRYD